MKIGDEVDYFTGCEYIPVGVLVYMGPSACTVRAPNGLLWDYETQFLRPSDDFALWIQEARAANP
jgi:hypothetical protein